MGYACPVCDDPQADAEHLANHLAFTAMLRSADHEAWLDEHVPEWADLDPAALADHVADHADETEFPQVFEDTTGDADRDHSHDHQHGHDHQQGTPGGRSSGPGLDAVENAAPGGVADIEDFEGDTDDVLAEARELTRKRRENATGSDAADGEGSDADGEDDDETGDS